MLLRTGEVAGLQAEVHDTLCVGLGLLGTAYAKVGQLHNADEVLRLGVQWAGDGDQSQDMFLRLGQTSLQGGHFGEAIGLLRRARSLGCSDSEVMPLLAQCYIARGHALAALACWRVAVRAGASLSAIETDVAVLIEQLGDDWTRVVSLIAGSDHPAG